MSKVALNKTRKKTALMDSAFELFTTEGFNRTTIRDIAHRAGVAKGTFYLYFNDKDAIRDEVIRERAGLILREAAAAMDEAADARRGDMSVADKFIYIIDYIIDHVAADKAILRLISKNLSWGMILRKADKASDKENDPCGVYPEYNGDADALSAADMLDFETYVRKMLEADGVKLRDTRLLIFTLLELVSSACYDVLIYEQPVLLEEYKPYLNNCIRLLVEDAMKQP